MSSSFPIVLSLEVAFFALLLVTPVAQLLAWLQARRVYPGRRLVDALILLPLVLPPSVTGYVLLVVWGKNGWLGRWLDTVFDVRLVFSPAGAVVAAAIVALPIVVKTAQPAFEAVPADLENVGRSLGLSPLALFFRVTLPCAWRGVVAALMLGFSRAIGEFGATLMFAGNIPGRTNTMPLEIFAAAQMGDDARARVYVAALLVTSIVVVAAASWLTPRWVRYE